MVMLLITGSLISVRIKLGATELVLMPSVAHSHAKLLASWFIAPVHTQREKDIDLDNQAVGSSYWTNICDP